MLHEVATKDRWNRKMYCGPTAACAILGEPEHHIYDAFKEAIKRRVEREGGRNMRAVKGVSIRDMQVVLRQFGHTTEPVFLKFRGTLRQFCKAMEITKEDKGKAILMHVRGHFITYKEGMILDTLTEGKAVPWREYDGTTGVGLKSKVKGMWHVKKHVRVRNFHAQIMDAIVAETK